MTPNIFPVIRYKDAPGAISWLSRAFGFEKQVEFANPDGTIAHAELRLGDSVVMCGDPGHGMDAMPAALSFYVDDAAAVDATYQRALAAGAIAVTAPQDQFYGYRSACVKDAGGNRWTICAVIELVSPDEAKRRMAELMKGSGAPA